MIISIGKLSLNRVDGSRVREFEGMLRQLSPPQAKTSDRSLDAFEFRHLLRKDPWGLVELDILIDAINARVDTRRTRLPCSSSTTPRRPPRMTFSCVTLKVVHRSFALSS
jgi:hypothetical protein